MAIKFNTLTKHGKLQFVPHVAVAFADDQAEEYFVAAGWADKSSEEPHHTFPIGTCKIDPDAVFADGAKKGRKILESNDG